MTVQAVQLPAENPTDRVNATLGMVFFIGSWTMAFGTLFLSFLILRHKAGAWPPAGVTLPSLPLAAVATGVLLASSAALHRAVRLGRTGERGFARAWSLGLLLGLAFAALQSWLWLDLLAAGRFAWSGLYESLFYGLTWVHAAHVAAGLVALVWIQIGILTGRYGAHRISTPGNAAIWWHFVDAVWVALFLGFFVF